MSNNSQNKVYIPSFWACLGDRNVLIAFSVTFMMTIGISSITPVLPLITRTFSISSGQTALLITLYTLPGIFLLPFTGVAADRFGRKVVLVPTILMFVAGGIGCALSESFNVLLFWRFFQGIGSAAMGFLPNILIADKYDGPAMPTIMGYNATVLSIGTALAPMMGGFLGYIDWRLPFLLPLLSIMTLVFAFRYPLGKAATQSTLSDYARQSFTAIRNKYTLILLLMGFLSFIMLYGPLLTCMPFMLDLKYQATPIHIGIVGATMSIGAAISGLVLGKCMMRFSIRNILLFSQLCYLIALLVIPNLSAIWMLLAPILIYGIGQGLNLPMISILQVKRAPVEQRAAIMSIHSMVLRLSQTVAPLIFGFAITVMPVEYGFFLGAIVAVIMMGISVIAAESVRKIQNNKLKSVK